MLRGVWQALNCLSIHATHCVIITGASPGEYPLRKYDVISISQDGSRDRYILLPVSYLLRSLPSEGQSLSANQISSKYLNWLLRHNYFRFSKTNFRHIKILLPVSISTTSHNLHVILHHITEFWPNWSTHCRNMTLYLFLEMAAATTKYYFRFRICWCHCLQKVKIY